MGNLQHQNNQLLSPYFIDHTPITNPQAITSTILKLRDILVLCIWVCRQLLQLAANSQRYFVGNSLERSMSLLGEHDIVHMDILAHC